MKHQSRGGRENRYRRAADVLLEHEETRTDKARELTDEALAKQADIGLKTARYCRAAFSAIRDALLLKGWRPPA